MSTELPQPSPEEPAAAGSSQGADFAAWAEELKSPDFDPDTEIAVHDDLQKFEAYDDYRLLQSNNTTEDVWTQEMTDERDAALQLTDPVERKAKLKAIDDQATANLKELHELDRQLDSHGESNGDAAAALSQEAQTQPKIDRAFQVIAANAHTTGWTVEQQAARDDALLAIDKATLEEQKEAVQTTPEQDFAQRTHIQLDKLAHTTEPGTQWMVGQNTYDKTSDLYRRCVAEVYTEMGLPSPFDQLDQTQKAASPAEIYIVPRQCKNVITFDDQHSIILETKRRWDIEVKKYWYDMTAGRPQPETPPA